MSQPIFDQSLASLPATESAHFGPVWTDNENLTFRSAKSMCAEEDKFKLLTTRLHSELDNDDDNDKDKEKSDDGEQAGAYRRFA